MASAGISVGRSAGTPFYGSTQYGGGTGLGRYGNDQAVGAEEPLSQTGQSAIGGKRIMGPDGKTSYETEYGETTAQTLAAKEKANMAAEARRMASMKELMAMYGGTGTSGTPSKGMAFDEEGARAAAFARAKDQAGQTARASLDALREHMGGNLGGAAEQQRSAAVIGGAAGDLGEFTRDQMIMDLDRAGSIADRNYQGDLDRERMANDQKKSLYALFSQNSGPIY